MPKKQTNELNRRDISCKSRGFTLIEILLALLIGSILVLGVTAAFKQSLMIFSRQEKLRPIFAQARMLTDIFRDELSGIYLPALNQEPQQEEDQELSYTFYLSTLGDGNVELEFYTLNPSLKGSLGISRPAKVRYRFFRDKDRDTYRLSRYEQACSGEKLIAVQYEDMVTDKLKEFSVSVFDNKDKQWKPSFQSNTSLPRSAKIAFRFADGPDGQQRSFSTSFLIPAGSQIIESQ